MSEFRHDVSQGNANAIAIGPLSDANFSHWNKISATCYFT